MDLSLQGRMIRFSTKQYSNDILDALTLLFRCVGNVVSPIDSFHVAVFVFNFLPAITIILGSLLWRKHSKPAGIAESDDADETGNSRKVQDLRALRGRHETASVLAELVDKDGAGAWPPKVDHDSWPAALRPYRDIYLEMVPLLPAAEPSLDDNVNNERRTKFRSLMRKLLAERINIAQVEDIMAAVEAGYWNVLPRDAYNGLYCCVAVCRHAYR